MNTPYLLTHLEWSNDETGIAASAVKDKDLKKRVNWLIEEALQHNKDAVPLLVESLKYIFKNRIEPKDDIRLMLYRCAKSRINWNQIAGVLIEKYLERK